MAMFRKYWTPPHSRIPEDFLDINRPHLTRDTKRARAMRHSLIAQRQERASLMKMNDAQEETPLLVDVLKSQPSGNGQHGNASSVSPVAYAPWEYGCCHAESDGLPCSAAACSPSASTSPPPSASPLPPPFSPDVPGRPRGPTHRPITEQTQAQRCCRPQHAFTLHADGCMDHAQALGVPPEMPHTPRSRLPNKGARYGAVAVEHAEHGGEKEPDQIPCSPQDKGVHIRQEVGSSSPLMSRSKHNPNPKDKYGLPMYHSRPASPLDSECEQARGGAGGAGKRGEKSRRAGWLILLVLALFVVSHMVLVVRTALQDMRERRGVQVALSPPAAASPHGQDFDTGAGHKAIQCVDLQALTWSRPHPLESIQPGKPHHQGSQEYKYMWLSSTHLTLPLGSPLFALFDEHVRGDIGVLGAHASTDPSAAAGDKGGEVDVLVEVKVQSSASDVLQETGAWGELGKYELCRVTRTGSFDITSSPASASDPESVSASSASPGIDTTGDKHVNTNNTHKSEGVDLRKITRAPADHGDGISFSVQLLLPSADVHGSDAPLYVPRLDIGIVRGDITVDVPGVEFGNVQLWTRDGAVHLGALKTGELGVHTGVRGRGGW